MGADAVDAFVLAAVVTGRLLIPLLIPRFPLPAIVAALVLDAADQSIFEQFTDLELDRYQVYDKALDVYYLTFAYVSVLRNWTNGCAVEVGRFLWYYRLVGVAVFSVTDWRVVLLVFPNTFEYFFVAYEAVRTSWDPRRLTRRHVYALAAGIWIVIKLPQEWWIHVAGLDVTDVVKEHVFGVEPDARWAAALADRPVVTVASGVLLLAAVVTLRSVSRRLPARDWRRRYDVDAPVPARPGSSAEPRLRWPLLEKWTLISLVSVVFAEALAVQVSSLQVIAGTVLVITVNAALSTVMAEVGASWRSLGVEFAVLVLANSALLGAFVGRLSSAELNRSATFFFGALLTLLIIAYDRFRWIRAVRTYRQARPAGPLGAERPSG